MPSAHYSNIYSRYAYFYHQFKIRPMHGFTPRKDKSTSFVGYYKEKKCAFHVFLRPPCLD